MPVHYAIIDTETTGLPRDPWARVVEIGAIAFAEGGLEVDSFFSLICPDILDHRADRALEYCGLDYERVANAPTTDSVRERFSEWLHVNYIERVYAYNQIFDQTMLERSEFYLPWAGCIMSMARQRSGKPNLTLSAACEHFYVPIETKHRALSDARMAAGVLHAINRIP